MNNTWWSAAKIALTYFIVGSIGILISDPLLAYFIQSSETIARLQTFKSWFFIIATALFLFWLIRHLLFSINEKENYNRTLFETTPIGLALCQMNGELVDINPAYARLLGCSVKDALQLNYWDVTPEEYAEQEKQQLLQLKKTGCYGPYDKEYIHKDGHRVSVRLSGTMLEKNGERLIWSTVEDTSERKQKDEQLHRIQKMDALGQLTGGIAHDFNNMLGVVMGYSQLLKNALSNQPRLLGYAHEVHHASERGAKLTKKLLAFTRKSRGDEKISSINALLLDEQHMLEKTLTARIKLSYNLSDNLWPVWLNYDDFEDCILNLSINAMHAIEGGGQLTITTSNEKINFSDAQQLNIEPDDYVMLKVSDTGCGMDVLTKEQIFEPFYSTKGEKGTGLGLSQVYGFIKRCNGAIGVDSMPGKGASFALYFPRFNKKKHNEQLIKENIINSVTGSESILVVDDEAVLLNLTCDVLELHGYHVMVAKDAPQSLNVLKNNTVDLMIIDAVMPGINGFELATMVSEEYPSIKIQMVSGYNENIKSNKQNCKFNKTLLTKPVPMEALLQRVHDLLN